MNKANIKILLLGDSGAGKTSFLKRYINNEYNKAFEITIGVDYGKKTFEYKGRELSLHIWDTAGQESFRSITKSYYRGSHGVLLFLDLTNPNGLKNIDFWLQSYFDEGGNGKVMLIGSKTDLRRKIPIESCHKFAEERKLEYAEISVRTSEYDYCHFVVVKLLEQINIEECNREQNKSIQLSKYEEPKGCGLCSFI